LSITLLEEANNMAVVSEKKHGRKEKVNEIIRAEDNWSL
jgi:hypothetical protein